MIACEFANEPMSTSQRTNTTFLKGLFDPTNDGAWEACNNRYRPIIIAVARRLGLNGEDAADVAQETMIRFFQEYQRGKYDRQKGRLKTWIAAIARYRIADLKRAKARRRELRGESVIAFVPDEDHLDKLWDEACRRHVLTQAMDELRAHTKFDEQTIEAFRRLSFDQQRPAEVAEALNMPIDSVYKAKQRCLKQLRTIIAKLNEAYDVSDIR